MKWSMKVVTCFRLHLISLHSSKLCIYMNWRLEAFCCSNIREQNFSRTKKIGYANLHENNKKILNFYSRKQKNEEWKITKRAMLLMMMWIIFFVTVSLPISLRTFLYSVVFFLSNEKSLCIRACGKYFFYFCNKLLVTWIYKKREQYFLSILVLFIQTKKQNRSKRKFSIYLSIWLLQHATHTRHNEIMMMMMVLYATAIFPCMFVGDVQLSHEQMNSICNLLPLSIWQFIIHVFN